LFSCQVQKITQIQFYEKKKMSEKYLKYNEKKKWWMKRQQEMVREEEWELHSVYLGKDNRVT